MRSTVALLQAIDPSAVRHFTLDYSGRFNVTLLVFLGVMVFALAANSRLETISGRRFARIMGGYVLLRSMRQVGGLLLTYANFGWTVRSEITAAIAVITIAVIASTGPMVGTIMRYLAEDDDPPLSTAAIWRVFAGAFLLAAVVVLVREGTHAIAVPSNVLMLGITNIGVTAVALGVALRRLDRRSIHYGTAKLFIGAQVVSLVAELSRLATTFAVVPVDTRANGVVQLMQILWIFFVGLTLLLFYNFVVARYPYAKLRREQERLHLAQAVRGVRSHDARLGQYVVGMSHELRNFMMGIRMMETALASRGAPAGQVGAVHQLNAQLEERIERLTAFANPAPTEQRFVDLPLFLERFRVVMDGLVVRHDVRVASTVRSLLVRIRQRVLEDSLIELLSNARDFSSPGSAIELCCERVKVGAGESLRLDAGDYAVLLVSDHGIGFSAEELAVAFDSQFTKRPSREVGFGLMSVRAQLQVEGGDLSISSELGKGTTVRLWIPCVETMP